MSVRHSIRKRLAAVAVSAGGSQTCAKSAAR